MIILFNKIISTIQNNVFLKNVLSLSSGVVIGQIISALGMPIISRIYTAASFGFFALMISTASIISAISVLGMMTVFMLPERDFEARELSRLVTISTILISSLIISALYAVSPCWKLLQIENEQYYLTLGILWVYIVVSVVGSICYAYVNRMKLYRVLFWNPIIGNSVNVLLGILFGKLGWGFVGYALANIGSMLANILHLVTYANPYSVIPINERIGYRKLLKSYQRFPKYQMPANLISNLSIQIPLQIMGIVFSPTILGYYAMANRIMSMPGSLIATPVNRVYFQEASRRYSNGEDIAEFGLKIMESNIKLAMIPIITLMIFGRWMFSFVLGDQWGEAGGYAAVLGIYFLISFCVQCLSGSFVIIGKNSWNLICAIINVFIGGMLYYIVKFFPNISIWTFLFIMALTFTAERVVEEGVYFVYLGIEAKRYIAFVVKWILFPFVLAFLIQLIFSSFVL